MKKSNEDKRLFRHEDGYKEMKKEMSNPDTKTYNHMFDLAFSVEGSEYKDGYECIQHEKEKLIKALTDRVNYLFGTKDYFEAFGLCDTYEEE